MSEQTHVQNLFPSSSVKFECQGDEIQNVYKIECGLLSHIG
jgi:hypothetical protein